MLDLPKKYDGVCSMFWSDKIEQETKGNVFNVEHYHVHDGEGIRTNVFLKGCNLWCPWCCNPESQVCTPQLVIHNNLCTKCGYCCTELCPQDAVTQKEDGTIVIDKEKCTLCGKCVEMCPNSARELYGKEMSVAEVIKEVEKDSAYYKNSGGGMTISGGEPCMQPVFASELAQAARRRYIGVAMETAGAVSFETLWQVAQYVDEILMDVKFTNEEQFKTISNVPLSVIKENLRKLREHGKYVKMRCPIIPTLNDNDEHIGNLIEWAKELDIQDVDLLPFHQLGKYKYDSLHYDYALGEFKDMDKKIVEKMKDRMVKAGINACIGG